MTPFEIGLLLGVAGGLHCAAMCGPLVLAVRGAQTPAGAFVYHGARLLVYAFAGGVAGLAGHGVTSAGFGRALSIAGGAALLAAAAHRLGWRVGAASPLADRATAFVGRAMGRARQRGRGPLAMAAAGALNALLPCGLLYAAIAASAASGSPTAGLLLMSGFGAGTVPMLIALPVVAALLPAGFRGRLRLSAPIALAALGLLLVARGVMPPHDAASHGSPAAAPSQAVHASHPGP